MSKFIVFNEDGTINTRLIEGTQNIPAEAVLVDDDLWARTITETDGIWKLIDGQVVKTTPDKVLPTYELLAAQVDAAADQARLSVVVDPVRVVEYDYAAKAAKEFADAGYPEDQVPAMVKAWAIGGRTAQEAADSILAENAAYIGALEQLRTTRLAAKQGIKDLLTAKKYDKAQALADSTCAAIKQAVEGVGNAPQS